jgi:hypothetical protein
MVSEQEASADIIVGAFWYSGTFVWGNSVWALSLLILIADSNFGTY